MYQYQFTVQGSPDVTTATSLLAKTLSAAGEFVCDLAGVPMCESNTTIRFQQLCATASNSSSSSSGNSSSSSGNSSSSSGNSSSSSSGGLVCSIPPPPAPVFVGVTVAGEGVNCVAPVPVALTTGLVTYLQELVTGVVVTVDGVTCRNEMVSNQSVWVT